VCFCLMALISSFHISEKQNKNRDLPQRASWSQIGGANPPPSWGVAEVSAIAKGFIAWPRNFDVVVKQLSVGPASGPA